MLALVGGAGALFSAVRSIGCAGKLPNLDFRSSPQRTVDVPWEHETGHGQTG
jgi:hypothetical protein